MHVLLSTDDKHRVTIDDTVMLASVLLEEYFDILEKSANGSYFLCTAKKVGETSLKSTLIGVRYGDEVKEVKVI